jgi:hypothetical protein
MRGGRLSVCVCEGQPSIRGGHIIDVNGVCAVRQIRARIRYQKQSQGRNLTLTLLTTTRLVHTSIDNEKQSSSIPSIPKPAKLPTSQTSNIPNPPLQLTHLPHSRRASSQPPTAQPRTPFPPPQHTNDYQAHKPRMASASSPNHHPMHRPPIPSGLAVT